MNEQYYLIIPTVLIPFTLISVGISVVATFIAGLFGYQLKAEGPKQLLEVLLKPKVLISAVIFNIIGFLGYHAYLYVSNLPATIWTINRKHQVISSDLSSYENRVKRITQATPALNIPRTDFTIQEQWSIKFEKGSFRYPALSSGRLFVATLSGEIVEVELETGTIKRTFYIGTGIGPSPVIRNNQLFTGEGTHYTHHARAYKFDLISGELLGHYSTKGHVEAQPIIETHRGETLMFIVAGKDGVHAVDPQTMQRKWHHIDGHIDGAVKVHNGRVFAGTGREKSNAKKFRSYAVAYDFHTGEKLWKHELAASSWMRPAVTQDKVCFILGEIYFDSGFGGLACFDQVSGEPLFMMMNDAPVIGVPFVYQDDILISDLKGKVCRVDLANKSYRWCRQVASKGKNMTTVSYHPNFHLLIYTTQLEGLFFLDPKTGKVLKHFMPAEWHKTYAGALPTEKGFVTVDKEGYLRKFDFRESK
jgi:hypothetical protein